MFKQKILSEIKPTVNLKSDGARRHSKEFQITNEENSGYENILNKMQRSQKQEKVHFVNKCDNPNCNTKFNYFKGDNKEFEACNFCSKKFCDNCKLECEYCKKKYCKFCIRIVYLEYQDINCCPTCE